MHSSPSVKRQTIVGLSFPLYQLFFQGEHDIRPHRASSMKTLASIRPQHIVSGEPGPSTAGRSTKLLFVAQYYITVSSIVRYMHQQIIIDTARPHRSPSGPCVFSGTWDPRPPPSISSSFPFNLVPRPTSPPLLHSRIRPLPPPPFFNARCIDVSAEIRGIAVEHAGIVTLLFRRSDCVRREHNRLGRCCGRSRRTRRFSSARRCHSKPSIEPPTISFTSLPVHPRAAFPNPAGCRFHLQLLGCFQETRPFLSKHLFLSLLPFLPSRWISTLTASPSVAARRSRRSPPVPHLPPPIILLATIFPPCPLNNLPTAVRPRHAWPKTLPLRMVMGPRHRNDDASPAQRFARQCAWI